MRFDVVEVDENEFEVVKSESGEFATFEEARKYALSLYDDRQSNLEDDIEGLEDHLDELGANRSELEALEEKDVRNCDEV